MTDLKPEDRALFERVLPGNTSLTNFTDVRISHEDYARLVAATREDAYRQGWNDRENEFLCRAEMILPAARSEGDVSRGGAEPVAWRVRCGVNHPLVNGEPFDWRLSEQKPEIGDGAKPEWFDIEPLFAAPPSREA